MKIINTKAATIWIMVGGPCLMHAALAIPPIPADAQAIPVPMQQDLSRFDYPASAVLQAYVKNAWPACHQGEAWQWASPLHQLKPAMGQASLPSSPRPLPRFLPITWQCQQPAATLKGIAHIHAWAAITVAKQNLPAGHTLATADLEQRWVDVLMQPSVRSQSSAVPPEGWEQKTLKKSLMAGQVLQASWLRHADELDSGQRVTLRIQGRGFALDSDGVLIQPARVGHTARVKTPQGKVLTGLLDRDGMVLVQ